MNTTPKKHLVTATRDAALSQRQQDAQHARELIHLVQRRANEVKDAFFDMGSALAELANNRLYLALGRNSFAEMVEKDTPFGLSQVKKFIAVAELVPRDEALKLGTERAYAITRLARVLPGGKPVRALLKDSQLVDGKSALEVTAKDIDRVVLRLRKDQRGKTRTPQDVEAHHKLARHAQAALRARGVRQALVTAVKRAVGWRMVVEIPPAAVEELLL